MELFLVCISGYFIGSFPSGLIFGKGFWRVDLRRVGSKNIGATNAYRALGPVPAALIFAADFIKGAAGVWMGAVFAQTPGAMILGGIAAIAGHNWPCWLRFSGGKGVATGLGVIAFLMPEVTAVVFAVWAVVVFATQYVSLASMIAAALVPVLAFFFGYEAEYLYFSFAAAAFVIYRHKSNIGRLLSGTESRIKAGRPPLRK